MKKQVKAWAIDQWGKKPLIVFTDEQESAEFCIKNPTISHQVLKGHFVYHIKRKKKK